MNQLPLEQSNSSTFIIRTTMNNACATSPRRGSALRPLLFLFALLISGMCASTPNSSNRPSAMFVMGDSSVDCGQNTLFYSLFHHNLSLYPCNGTVSTLVPYILAEKMGLPQMQPFYSLNGSISTLLRGINFGSAQATIINSGKSLQSLSQQLRQVTDTFQQLQLQLSQETAKHLIRSFIFYVSFGKNDYTDIFLRNTSGIMSKGGQQFAHILVGQMIHALWDLYQADIRKIVVMGILPLGCAPRMMLYWRNKTDDGGERGCVDEVNAWVVAYNTLLEDHVVEFRNKYPDAQIVFCDVYRVVLEIITHPMSYGFEDVKRACCGLGWYGAMIGCLSHESACSRSSTYVWLDFYNPTSAVNSFLAESGWSGKPILIYECSGIKRELITHMPVYRITERNSFD
uniref:GDSL esterase/lipase n=1 Tax=Kalanchoe fedtschenkoi TaxID=63787 RepID=A0A7N0VHY6_KALFE